MSLKTELPPKVALAMNAMEAIGLSWERTKPVLKNLLRTYDYNWDLIESENYRVLADAVLDSLEIGVEQEDNSLLGKRAKVEQEDNSLLGKRAKVEQEDNSLLGKRAKIDKEQSYETPKKVHKNRKDVAIAVNRSLSKALQMEEPNSSVYSPPRSLPTKASASVIKSAPVKLELASSSSREVRLIILCNPLQPSPSFAMPTMELLSKMVLKRCNLDPGFSLLIILKEICLCIMDLLSRSSQEHKNSATFRKTNPTIEPGSHNHTEPARNSVYSTNPATISKPDICRGEENLKISVAKALNFKPCPPSFHYIPRNIVYQNAYVDISLARIGDEDCCSACRGDCLASPIPCACARETCGEYAYTSDGLLKKEFLEAIISMKRVREGTHLYFCKDCPIERIRNEMMPEQCKGHSIRKFVKECWSKCGCDKACGNRLVQRGITRNLQVFWTGEGKGWGLRTLDKLPIGSFICEYVGEILTNTELYERQLRITGNMKHTYPVLLDADWGSEQVLKDEEALCLDATFYGNVARFINHRCADANIIEVPVEVETPDHHYYHVAFFTMREVEALEELTWDYGIDFSDYTHPIKAFSCRCGSKFCRDFTQIRKRPAALVLG